MNRWQVVIDPRCDEILPVRTKRSGKSPARERFLRNDHGMRSGDLRTRLREQLRAAVRDRDRIAVAALRDAISALDNAEAVEPGAELWAASSEYVAGGVVGLGAGEVERRVLDPEAQRAIVNSEIEGRLAAATTYEQHGHTSRANDLRGSVEVLLAVLDAPSEGD